MGFVISGFTGFLFACLAMTVGLVAGIIGHSLTSSDLSEKRAISQDLNIRISQLKNVSHNAGANNGHDELGKLTAERDVIYSETLRIIQVLPIYKAIIAISIMFPIPCWLIAWYYASWNKESSHRNCLK